MKHFIKLISGLFLITACKTNSSRIIVFDAPAEVKVTANSACKNSGIVPLENEEGLKNNLQTYAAASLKEMKFKTNKTLKKSTCRISDLQLVITESCQAKAENNPPAIKLSETLTLENVKTKETYHFEVDTIINNQKLNPNSIAVKKVDYQSYIQPLTERNFKKAKDFFSNKK